jgi:hypothetical protein
VIRKSSGLFLSRGWLAQEDAEDKRVRSEQERNQDGGDEVRGTLKARSETYAGTIPLVCTRNDNPT